jgi:site-specific DNA recombinase
MGRRAKAKTGGYAGGRVPIGYKVKNKELVIDDREAWIVREIFKMRRQKKSHRKIAEELEERGVLGRERKPIGYTTVGSILSHEEFYKGVTSYAGITAQGKHPAIL